MEHVQLRRDEYGGVTVVMDGQPQSHVQPDDPTVLVFEYVQHLALALDSLPAGRLAVTHVGGGGLTLPRYVAATRPGSPQVVLEPDGELTRLVRAELPLPRGHRIRVREQRGEDGIRALADGSADVVVTDAYAGGRVPPALSGDAYAREVARVLRPTGVGLWNLADEPRLRWAARVIATIRRHLPHVCLVATHEVLKGRRFGNAVVVASPAPFDEDSLRRAVARSALPTGLRAGTELDRLLAGAPAFGREGEASPAPPEAGGWRAR